MVGAFKVRYSPAVAVSTSPDFRSKIINDAVALAERAVDMARETAIFNVDGFDLKVVVQFATRQIWILTKDEAEAGNLPDRPGLHNQN